MGGLLHTIGHALKTGFDMTETGQRFNESKLRQEQEQSRLNDAAGQSVEHWQSLGGKLIHDGLVADDGPPGPDGKPTKIYRPVNPERYTAKVKAGKDTLQFEIPNDAEQHAYQIGRQVADVHTALTNPTAASDRETQQKEAARGAGMTLDEQNRAKENADERTRQRIGTPIPNDIADALGMDPNVPGSGFSMPAAAPLQDQAPAPAGAQDLPVGRTPAQSAAAAPGAPGQKRLLLPKELDELATAAGKFVDYQSKADARTNPPAKARTVHNVTPSADGRTQIITFTNGDVEEKPLTAGAKPAETDTEISLAKKIGLAKRKGALATQQEKDDAAEAEITLKRLDQSKREARPINTTTNLTVGGTTEAPSTAAQLVANYGLEINKALPPRTPPAEREKFMQQVLKINPDYQEQFYNTFQRTEQDAVTGKIGTQGNALNTMMGHMGVLKQAALDLKNSDLPALNHIANSLGVAIGRDPTTTYNTIVHRIGPEVGKAYGEATGGERLKNEEDFTADRGPDQLLGAIGISALLADSKIKALQKQYQDGTKGHGKIKLLTNESEGIRQNLLGNVPQNLGGTKGKAATPPAGKIAVIDPEGNPAFIDAGKWELAKSKGFKLPQQQ